MRYYVIGIAIGYFVLWAYMSDWSLYDMVFWESNDDLRGPAYRLGAGFVVGLAGVLTALGGEGKV